MVLLTGTFILFILADAFFSLAVIYHLRQYTMPGWTGGRIAIVLYVALAGILLALAIYYFRGINPDDLADLVRGGLTLPGGLGVR